MEMKLRQNTPPQLNGESGLLFSAFSHNLGPSVRLPAA
jgi:hypothetical protein